VKRSQVKFQNIALRTIESIKMKDMIIIVLILAIGVVGTYNVVAYNMKPISTPYVDEEIIEEPIDEEEVLMFGRLIYSEAISNDYGDMLAVGSVVMNRLENQTFNKGRWESIEDVISARKQFSGYKSKKYSINIKKAKARELNAFRTAIEAARYVMEGYRSFDDTVLYYFNPLKATNTTFTEWASESLELALVNEGVKNEVHYYYSTDLRHNKQS